MFFKTTHMVNIDMTGWQLFKVYLAQKLRD